MVDLPTYVTPRTTMQYLCYVQYLHYNTSRVNINGIKINKCLIGIINYIASTVGSTTYLAILGFSLNLFTNLHVYYFIYY